MIAATGLIAHLSADPAIDLTDFRQRLVAMVDGRPFAGRLVGLRHVPIRAGVALAQRDLASTAELWKRLPVSDRVAGRAWVALLQGDVAAAIADLEAAAQEHASAALHSDLCVAYLARAGMEGRAFDWIEALEEAHEALRLDPGLPAARFNVALALEGLRLRSQALAAWDGYLSLEPGSPWAAEARERRGRLVDPGEQERWSSKRADLQQAAEQQRMEVVREVVSRHRLPARHWAQGELLAQWGHMFLNGGHGRSERILAGARAIGEALAEINGEHSVADAVQAIDTAPAGLRDRLAAGHMAYAAGTDAFDALDVERAAMSLEAAKSAFREAKSPALFWAELWIAGTDYYSNRPQNALGAFQRLEVGDLASRYPALGARAKWALGLMRKTQMRPGESRAAFEDALKTFKALGEEENAGAVAWLVAEACEELGELEAAWDYRLQALELLRASRDSRWRRNLLLTSAQALLRADLLASALSFQTEGLSEARSVGGTESIAEAMLVQGRILAGLGRSQQALDTFGEAEELVERITSEVVRERLSHDAGMAEAQARLASGPAAFLASLSESIEYYRAAGRVNHLALAYLLRGRAFLASGDEDRAHADLLAGIETYERARAGLSDDRGRQLFFEQWQPFMDELIELEAVRRGDAAAAFAYLERAKAGDIAQALATGRRSSSDGLGAEPLDLTQVRRELPSGESMVVYAVLPERILIWPIPGDPAAPKAALIDLPLAREKLAQQVAELRAAILRPWNGDELDRRAAALYDLLLRPALRQLPDEDRLVLVPDKELHTLPFAALVHRESGRFLVEQRAISVAQSANSYARIVLRPAKHERATWSVLAVGDPEIGARIRGQLGDLPAAKREAREVRGLYAGGKVLASADATLGAVLGELSRHDVLHFAGHATARPGDPGSARLLLAPDPSTGRSSLQAEDLVAIRLDHLSLVVLSACSTAPGSHSRGDGVSGLARVFQVAGVPALLASLWPVEDSPSHLITVAFHRHLLAGAHGSEALRAAQLDLIHDADPVLRRPSVWAAFQLVGAVPSSSTN